MEDPGWHWEVIGHAPGDTTQEVADNLAERDWEFAQYYDSSNLSYWGWRLSINPLGDLTMCEHTGNYDDCPCCRELYELRSRVEELEAEMGKGVHMSNYSMGYADGEREGRTTQLQIQLGIIVERNRFRAALEELADCDFDDGWSDSWHSPNCRKCKALNRKEPPDEN